MFSRILTGVVLAPSVFALVALGPLWGTRLFFTAAAAVGAHELMRMMGSGDASEDRYDRIVAILVTTLFVGAASILGPVWVGAILPVAVMGILLSGLGKPGDISRVGRRLSSSLGTLAYVGGLFLSMVLLTHAPGEWSRWGILVTFFAVWPGDTLAFFSGKFIGGKKLYPIVSPKKTWAGSVGGLVGSIGGLLLLQAVWVPELTTQDCIVLGTLCGAFEQAGDLCESLFKRSFGVKDSGSLLPGHGGILDRVDGLIFAGPIVFAWLQITHG